VAGLVILATARAGEAQTDWRWHFQEGENLHYTIEEKSKTTMKAQDKGAFVLSQTLVLDTTWTVRRVDRSGQAAFSVRIHRIRFQADSEVDGGEVKVKVDTRDPKQPQAQPAKGVAEILQALAASSITLDMSARGDVSNLKLDAKTRAAFQTDVGRELAGFFGDTFREEEGIKRMLTGTLVVLPSNGPTKSDSWKQSLAADPIRLGPSVRTYTAHGPEIWQDRQLEKIAVKVELVPQPDKEKIKKQSSQGVVYFDRRAGAMVKSEINLKLSLDVPFLAHSEHESITRVERKPN
jgi:hypothetical protein